MTPESIAKYFALILYPINWEFRFLEDQLSPHFGLIDYRGAPVPFDRTTYYEKEMGGNLVRQVISFSMLKSSEFIMDDKLKAIEIEKQFTTSSGRVCNIDVGYMDFDKVVFPSVKKGPRKIYAGKGIWLDMQLWYQKGIFTPFEWAFEDIKAGYYHHDFVVIREKFKAALRRKE